MVLHPYRDIFTSLPKAGAVRAARLLAEIGDTRGRFPTPGKYWTTHNPYDPDRHRILQRFTNRDQLSAA